MWPCDLNIGLLEFKVGDRLRVRESLIDLVVEQKRGNREISKRKWTVRYVVQV